MWSKEESLQHIIDNELPISSRAFNAQFQLKEELTEEWEGGWIFQFSPIVGYRYDIRFLVEKRLHRCIFVGSAGIGRAIDKCYGYL